MSLLIDVQKVEPELGIKDGLGHGEMCAAADLLVEAIYLFHQVRARGITGHGNREIARFAHLLPALIIAFVKAIDNAHQPY